MTMFTHIHHETRELPFVRPFVTSKGSWDVRQVCVVCVQVDGHSGLGEAAPLPGFSAESFEQALSDVAEMCAMLRRCEAPRTLDEVRALMHKMSDYAPSARFGVEGALLDLVAKLHDVSVARLLDPRASASVQVNATLGARPAPESFAQAMVLKEKGFRCFKIKVGVKPLDEEMASVRAIREAVGDAAELRLDANGAWGVPQAIESIKKMSRYGVALVEQPVARDDFDGLASVRAQSGGVLIAADESIQSVRDLERALNIVDVVVLKPMILGGALATFDMIQSAHARGVKVILTTMLEGVIGRTLTLHLAAACASALHGACGLATGNLLASDLAEESATLRSGAFHISRAPGLGLSYEAIAPPAPGMNPSSSLPVLARRALSHGPQMALRAGDVRLDFAALHERAARLVTWLCERGVRRGDRVVMSAANSVALVEVVHALMAAGICMVPVHPKLTAAEFERAVSRVKPALVLVDTRRDVACVQTLLSEATEESAGLECAQNEQMRGYAMQDRAVVLFTSGTTGEPKMAALSWSNLFHSAMGSAIRLGHLPGERWLLSLPMCHIGGLSIVVRCALLGTGVVLHEGFDAKAVAQELVSGEVSMWSAVSAMMWRVLDELGDRQVHPGFRFALLGGGAVPESLLLASQARGIPCATTYGMTETGSQLTTRAPDMPGTSAQSAGPALLFSEVRVRGGAEGELEVRGETLFEGYLDEGLVVRDERDEQGWFATGDWGYLSEAKSVHVLDRRTDLIVTGGENVYPAEVEQVLSEHDGVRDVCVIGLPDERWGQRVVAVIVPEQSVQGESDVAEIIAMSRSHLAGFKVPRQVELWGELPRTSLRKLCRAQVRRELMERGTSPQ